MCNTDWQQTEPEEATAKFVPVMGTIRSISDFSNGGCVKLFSLIKKDGTVTDFVVDASTYFTENIPLEEGMTVTFYYDTDVPAVLIYPPQYRAVVGIPGEGRFDGNIKVDYFNSELISRDNMLKLDLSDDTKIFMQNGQYFNGDIAEHNLVVFYTTSTKSIPAETTPEKIVVLCNMQ
ncbi:hypothetical protein MUJ63_05135 [Lachnospiraceae bacterium NSJ-143]|nr:hypothetical protein [Lachnospiraceae bacterium NSJ-143]